MKRLATKIELKWEKPLSEYWMGKGDVGICYTKSHKSVHKRKQSEMEKCSALG